jgi:hypothetical protein
MASGMFCVLLIVASLYAVSCEQNNTLQCYQCNSGEGFDGKTCGESAEAALKPFLHVCEGTEYTRCRKQVQTVEEEARVIRSCATAGTSGSQDRCTDRVGTARIKIKYCECNNQQPGKACNSAFVVTSSVTSFLVCGLLALWGRV